MGGIMSATYPLWTPYSRVVLKTPNLVACYPHTEDAGTRLTDIFGGQHGALVAGPTLRETGPLLGEPSAGIKLSGTGQWATLPKVAALDANPRLSIEVWLKTSTAGLQGIWSFYNGDELAGWELLLGSNTKLIGAVYGSSAIKSTGWANGSGSALNDGVWHQVGFSANASSIDLYVDGLLNLHTAGTWTHNVLPGNVPVIGARSTALPITGSTSWASLYARDLTPAEWAAHFAAAKG